MIDPDRATAGPSTLRGSARHAEQGDSILRLQLRFVRGNERANVGRHIQQLQPLFFIQGHRKAPHAVDRDCSLFADLHADACGRPLFESGVFIAKALEFRFQFFVGHGVSWFVYRCIPKSSATEYSKRSRYGSEFVEADTLHHTLPPKPPSETSRGPHS